MNLATPMTLTVIPSAQGSGFTMPARQPAVPSRTIASQANISRVILGLTYSVFLGALCGGAAATMGQNKKVVLCCSASSFCIIPGIKLVRYLWNHQKTRNVPTAPAVKTKTMTKSDALKLLDISEERSIDRAFIEKQYKEILEKVCPKQPLKGPRLRGNIENLIEEIHLAYATLIKRA